MVDGPIDRFHNMEDFEDESPRKRLRLIGGSYQSNPTASRPTLDRPISPPLMRRARKDASPVILPSPFQLTKISELPDSSNVETVSLRDILGDPLIAECWEFNYLHDLDFLMGAFDPDVKDLVKVNVVHGFWKSEDATRQRLKVRPLPLKIMRSPPIPGRCPSFSRSLTL